MLFNRFYQPDFGSGNLAVVPDLVLSMPTNCLMRLRWVAILYGRVIPTWRSPAASHMATDVLKSMMAGANVAMMDLCTPRTRIEPRARRPLDLQRWMEIHEYESISQMRGSMSQKGVAEPAAFERRNYMKMLQSYEPIEV